METDPKDKRPQLTFGEMVDLNSGSFGQQARIKLEESERQEEDQDRESSR